MPVSNRKNRRYESCKPARPAPATDALPGTPDKQAVMAKRFGNRQSLHAPGDPIDTPRIEMCLHALALWLDESIRAEEEQREMTVSLERVRRNVMRLAPGVGENSQKDAGEDLTRVITPTPGDRIRAARLDRKLSQSQLARQASISQAALSRLERRDRMPCLWTLYRLALALGVTLDHLSCISADEAGVVRCLCA